MALKVQKNISLAAYTTLHIGGVADYVVEVTTVDELKEALQLASSLKITPLIIGGGSNLLISDTGYRGLALVMNIKGRLYEKDKIEVRCRYGAGEILDEVIAETVCKGYWGLENLSAIPGTVGATPIQNVGAYGVEVSHCLESVTAIHRETLEEKLFSHHECAFGYRDSFFKTELGKSWIITAVTFVLSLSPKPQLHYKDLQTINNEKILTLEVIRTAVSTVRTGKFPDWRVTGTAGSFFKNPIISAEHASTLREQYPELPVYPQSDGQVKVSLGWILDHVCSLRGYTDGRIGLYEKQALVLVCERGTTAVEVEQFSKMIADIVYEKTRIIIEKEVTVIQ